MHRRPLHDFIKPGNGSNYATAHMNRRRALAVKRHHALPAHN
jgi:hypothetical protein